MRTQRRIFKAAALFIIAVTVVSVLTGCFGGSSPVGPTPARTAEPKPREIVRTLDFEVKDGSAPLEQETYRITNVGDKRTFVYDMDCIDVTFGWAKVGEQDVINTLNANTDIPEKYRAFINEYINRVAAKHPEVDLRVFNENLKTLKVIECTKNELMRAAMSADSYGCYVQTENCIYILEGPLPEEGTWDFQVIYHELGHAMRLYNRNDGKDKVSEGLYCKELTYCEAMNSLFAVSLFNYDEKDIAYQLQSNYYAVLLECLDGYYDISDYMNHSQSYFAKVLDEYNGDVNYAHVMIKLMEAQYDDYHDDYIERDFELYKPIYEYAAKMYYGKYITDGMTEAEMRAVADELKEKIMFDVPAAYGIDTQVFYDCLPR